MVRVSQIVVISGMREYIWICFVKCVNKIRLGFFRIGVTISVGTTSGEYFRIDSK